MSRNARDNCLGVARMRAAVFNVELTLEEFWPDGRVPVELRSDCRIPLFHEIVGHARSAGVHLAVLPGGFFRTDRPGGIAAAIKKNPPRIRVLVGRDDVSGVRREAWAVTRAGGVSKRFPEIWTEKIAGLAPSRRCELLPELLESIGKWWEQPKLSRIANDAAQSRKFVIETMHRMLDHARCLLAVIH